MSVQINGQNNTQQIQQLKMLKGMKGGQKLQGTKKSNFDPNSSIFSLVSDNQAKANKSQPQLRTAASPMANKAAGVVQANTKASVNNIGLATGTSKAAKTEGSNNIADAVKTEGTNSKGDVKTGTTVSDIKSGVIPDDFKKLDVSNVYFSNLQSYSEAQLAGLKHDLEEIVNDNCPFFLRVPFQQKLDKVEKAISEKAGQDGDKVSEDNKKQEADQDLKAASEEGTKTAEGGAKEAQSGTATVKKLDDSAKDTEKNLKQATSKLNKQQAKAQADITKNTSKIDKEIQKVAEITAENEQLNTDIELISGQISEAKAAGGEGVDEKVNDLSAQLQVKSGKVQANTTISGKSVVAMHKYTTQNAGITKTLTKANKSYIKTVNAAQQQIQSQQQETSGIEKTLNKINDISSKVALGGTIAKYTGMVMSKTGWPPTVAAGIAMQVAGTAAETAGNYGVCVSNIGLTAVNVANGNFIGALTTAGTAFMSGASAIQNTKQLAAAADAAGKATTEAGKEVAKDLGKDVAKDAGTDAVKDAGKDMSKNLLKETVKDSAGNVVKDAAGNATKQIANSGIKGFANGVAVQLGKQSTTQMLMGLGSALTNAASVFGQQDQGGQGEMITHRRVNAQHGRRRKIA